MTLREAGYGNATLRFGVLVGDGVVACRDQVACERVVVKRKGGGRLRLRGLLKHVVRISPAAQKPVVATEYVAFASKSRPPTSEIFTRAPTATGEGYVESGY